MRGAMTRAPTAPFPPRGKDPVETRPGRAAHAVESVAFRRSSCDRRDPGFLGLASVGSGAHAFRPARGRSTGGQGSSRWRPLACGGGRIHGHRRGRCVRPLQRLRQSTRLHGGGLRAGRRGLLLRPCLPERGRCASGSACARSRPTEAPGQSACLSLSEHLRHRRGPPAAPDAGGRNHPADVGRRAPAASAGRRRRRRVAAHCPLLPGERVHRTACTATPRRTPAKAALRRVDGSAASRSTRAPGSTARSRRPGGPSPASTSPSSATRARRTRTTPRPTRPQIIDAIFTDVAALSPMPSFVVSTGDYQFASTTGSRAGAAARPLRRGRGAKYPGALFPAMGNHECTGADRLELRYRQRGRHHHELHDVPVEAPRAHRPDLAVLRHQHQRLRRLVDREVRLHRRERLGRRARRRGSTRRSASPRPTRSSFATRRPTRPRRRGSPRREAIIAKHPYTLEHRRATRTRTGTSRPKEVLFGNGGAPLSGSGNYGYGIFSQQSDGTIAVDAIDYATGLADGTFHFAVKADGTAAP